MLLIFENIDEWDDYIHDRMKKFLISYYLRLSFFSNIFWIFSLIYLIFLLTTNKFDSLTLNVLMFKFTEYSNLSVKYCINKLLILTSFHFSIWRFPIVLRDLLNYNSIMIQISFRIIDSNFGCKSMKRELIYFMSSSLSLIWRGLWIILFNVFKTLWTLMTFLFNKPLQIENKIS